MSYKKRYQKDPKDFLRIYFDTETYQYNDPESETGNPIIIPYLVGVCTEEPNSYQYFVGVDAAEQFLEWLFKFTKNKITTLIAFNIDYDFWAIFPSLRDTYPNIKVRYKQDGNRKFISGQISNPKIGVSINLKDLWVWNKADGLSKYYKEIHRLSQSDEFWSKLTKKYGLENLEKLSIEDYCKNDMFQGEDGNLYYYDHLKKLKKLNLEHELAYLKNDVIGLPLVNEYIEWFKRLCCETLDVPFPKKIKLHSIPSFGKYLLEAKVNKPMIDTFRVPISVSEYYLQSASYFGGFSGVNRHHPITEFEEERIFSYDVNSMYPWVMWEGIPYGDVYDEPPSGKYCTWYEIYFEKEIEPGKLYRYKPQYDFFNNEFFGKYFFKVQKASAFNGKAYIEKSVLELFERVCDSHVVIQRTKYQKLTRMCAEFIEQLYEIKSNKEKYSAPVIGAIKLILNALYGKFAERFHTNYYELEDNTVMMEKINESEDRFSMLAGLYITSKSRVRLLKSVYDEVDNGNIVLCCDTDSIKMIKNKPPKIDIDAKRLGAWKEEGKFTGFYHVNKCKKYYSYNAKTNDKKVVFSGIPEAYITCLTHEELKTLYCPDNDTLFPKAKNTCYRNEYYQIVIRDSDIRFNSDKGKEITHKWEEGKLVPYGKED